MSSVQTQSPAVLAGRQIALPAYARLDLAFTQTIIVAPLAAGLVTLHTVAGGRLEILQQVTFTWQTSAVVANRSLGLEYLDAAGDVLAQTLVNGTQAASLSYRYTLMLDAGASFVAGTFGLAQLPFMYMNSGEQWRIFGSGIDPGDSQNGLTYTVVVVPTGPNATQTQAAPIPTPLLV